MAVINVPRKLRKSGSIRVEESLDAVRLLIASAQRRNAQMITLVDAETGQAFDIKHVFIHSVTKEEGDTSAHEVRSVHRR